MTHCAVAFIHVHTFLCKLKHKYADLCINVWQYEQFAQHLYINRRICVSIYIRMVLRTINAEICFAHNEDQRLLQSNILHVQKGHIALLAVHLLKYVVTFSLALNGGGRFLSSSSPLSSLLCSLVSWETLSALLSKLKYYGLTGLLMQLTLSKLGFRGTWLPWRNVRSLLYDGAWERWRIVCLAALSVEDIDIYLFGTMITGILLIGLGFTLGYRRIQKTGTAVQSPTRLPVWLKLWEERSALRLRL